MQMNKLKKWYSEHKDKPLFKAKLLLVVLIILSISVSIFNNYRDEKEAANEETEREDVLLDFW